MSERSDFQCFLLPRQKEVAPSGAAFNGEAGQALHLFWNLPFVVLLKAMKRSAMRAKQKQKQSFHAASRRELLLSWQK